MAEADAGLIIPVGFTERAAAQAAARIEAQAIKAAKASEQAFVKANANIVKSTGAMSGQMRGQIQNVSYQLQDVFVQIAGGTDASRALSQQLPQLASGFGAVGAVIGTVLAVAIPLAAQFITLGDGTEELAKATEAAEKALATYREAMGNTGLSAQELAARYGEAAGAARELLGVLAQTAETKALLAQTSALDALQERFSGISDAVAQYRLQTDEISRENWAIDIADQFGLAIDQATRMADILDEINSTTDANRRNSLMVELVGILNDAAKAGGDVNMELVNATEEAARTGMAVLQIGAAADGASGQVASLAADMANLAAQANSAAAAMGAAGVFVGSDGSIQTGARGRDPSTDWRFEDPNKDYDTIGERRAREAAEKAAAAAREAKRLAGGGGGGGRKKSGGGGRSGGAAKEPVDIFESAGREIQQLERQIELLGKSNQEVATAEARWAMLDAAKKAGIQVNDEMNAKIEAQAAQVGNLTQQLEQAELAQEQFDQAIEGIANAFSNVILEGENLRDSLASIFKQIAANILNAGIQQALSSAFGGAGGGGFWGGLLSAAFGGTKAATPSFDGGGFTGYGARSGGIDGKGGFPAILHPNETVLDHTRGQSRSMGGATFAPTINVGGNVTQDDIARIYQVMEVERKNFIQNVRRAQAEIGQRYN